MPWLGGPVTSGRPKVLTPFSGTSDFPSFSDLPGKPLASHCGLLSMSWAAFVVQCPVVLGNVVF